MSALRFRELASAIVIVCGTKKPIKHLNPQHSEAVSNPSIHSNLGLN